MGEPALRIYDGQGPLTVRGALVAYVLPTLDSPSKATVQQLWRAVSLWEEFGEQRSAECGVRSATKQPQSAPNSKTRSAKIPGKSTLSIGTGSTDATRAQPGGAEESSVESGELRARGIPVPNPDVSDIDDVLLAAFREWCVETKGHASTTWNKTWRRIRQILRKLGPAERGNPTGLGKIVRVPHIRLASEPKRGKRIVSLDDLDAWYRAAEHATWPEGGASAVRQWRALLVLGYTTGLRTVDAQQLDREAVTTDPHCPDSDVTWTNQHGWLCVTPHKTKRHGREVILPLSECLAGHLSWLLASGASRLFSFGAANRHFAEQWQEITRRAGVRPFHFGDLRKTCNTAFNQIRPGLGKWVLGHAARGVNETFYLDIMPQLIAGIEQLPLPAAFADLSDKPVDRQMRLF